MARKWTSDLDTYVDETIDNHHVFTRKTGRSCEFVITDDRTGWRMTGSEPGPCSKAHTTAKQIVADRVRRGLANRARRRRRRRK
jgi:hypothetical protein